MGKLYKNSQIKAAISVNKEMLIFYWTLGKDIVKLKAESKWGSGFYENLSLDLQKMIQPISLEIESQTLEDLFLHRYGKEKIVRD